MRRQESKHRDSGSVILDGFLAYIVGPDGHIINRVDLVVEEQDDAEERAKALVDEHDIELW